VFRCFLGPKSFDSLERLLAHKQASFPIILGGIKLISTSTITSTTYLGSWALVTLIIVDKFMINQRPFLFESLVQVDNNTFPFQQHLKTICDLIPPLARAYFSFFENLIGQQMVHFQDSISKRLHHHTFSNMLSNGIFKAYCA
jgi:hypothetical protein